MAIERTYIMLKPDCIQRGLMGAVISRIENKGHRILEARMMKLDAKKISEHYAHVVDRDFFPELLEYMTSGPVFGMIVEGENAIKGMRLLMGPTKVEEAEGGTVRGDYAIDRTRNFMHAADSVENAAIEIKRFFG